MSAAWWRLWAPELAAGTVTLIVVPDRLRPTPTVPWPRPLSSAGLKVWENGLVWPPASTVWAHLAIAALAVAAITAADFKFATNRRRARMLRWRWDRTVDGARLYRIRIGKGVATATCSLHGGDWDALATKLHVNKGGVLRNLRLDRRWGSPIRAYLSTTGYKNPAKSRRLRLSFVPLGNPWSLPTYELPAQGSKVMVGHSVDGPLMVDLDKVPHMRVVGGTGSGKGFFLRLLEVQALRAGWLGVLIDGGNSPEHAFVDGAPTFLRPMRGSMNQENRLRAALAALKAVTAITDRRSEVSELFGATRWADLPAAIRDWQPRIVLIVDELTALLADSKDKTLDQLRAQLRQALDTEALRNGRKFGVAVLPLSDQFAYSGVLPKAASWQAEGVVVLGNLAPEHVKQATGLASLPSIPDGVESLAGHFVRVGQPNPLELRIPPNDKDTLVRAVAYVRGEGS